MCSLVNESLVFHTCQSFWFDILHAITELKRASHRIAANSDYQEVSIIMLL